MPTLMFTLTPTVKLDRGSRFGKVVRGAVQAMYAEWRARRAARNAASLSDEMLHDIGLARGEIDRAVRFGRVR